MTHTQAGNLENSSPRRTLPTSGAFPISCSIASTRLHRVFRAMRDFRKSDTEAAPNQCVQPTPLWRHFPRLASGFGVADAGALCNSVRCQFHIATISLASASSAQVAIVSPAFGPSSMTTCSFGFPGFSASSRTGSGFCIRSISSSCGGGVSRLAWFIASACSISRLICPPSRSCLKKAMSSSLSCITSRCTEREVAVRVCFEFERHRRLPPVGELFVLLHGRTPFGFKDFAAWCA